MNSVFISSGARLMQVPPIFLTVWVIGGSAGGFSPLPAFGSGRFQRLRAIRLMYFVPCYGRIEAARKDAFRGATQRMLVMLIQCIHHTRADGMCRA